MQDDSDRSTGGSGSSSGGGSDSGGSGSGSGGGRPMHHASGGATQPQARKLRAQAAELHARPTPPPKPQRPPSQHQHQRQRQARACSSDKRSGDGSVDGSPAPELGEQQQQQPVQDASNSGAAQRRSTRERSQPKQVYVPCWTSAKVTYLGGNSRRPKGKVLLGDAYQATLPPLIPRLRTADRIERSLMGQRLQYPVRVLHTRNATADATGSHARLQPQHELVQAARLQLAGSGLCFEQRHEILAVALKQMDSAARGEGRVVDTDGMGPRVRSEWSAQDEAAFGAGLAALRHHDFVLLRRDYLPHKSVTELVSYYYNVAKSELKHRAVAGGSGARGSVEDSTEETQPKQEHKQEASDGAAGSGSAWAQKFLDSSRLAGRQRSS
ncbi:hypothetical protein FOA52_002946 [Chlamydomonas sp. UWO 241]|nr:hypothetical protein FOA52_002946 [Chlamydomonas sp. UWO 241]